MLISITIWIFFSARNRVVISFIFRKGVYFFFYLLGFFRVCVWGGWWLNCILFINLKLKECSHWRIHSYLECIHNTPSYSRTSWSRGSYTCHSLFLGPGRGNEGDLSIFVSTRSLWSNCRRYSRPVHGGNMLGRYFLESCSPSCNQGISLRKILVEFRSSRCPNNWFASSHHCRRSLCYTDRDTLQ